MSSDSDSLWACLCRLSSFCLLSSVRTSQIQLLLVSSLSKNTFTRVIGILKLKIGQKVSDLHFSDGETRCLPVCAAFYNELVFDKTSLPLLSNKTLTSLDYFRITFRNVYFAYTAAMVSQFLNNNPSPAIQL